MNLMKKRVLPALRTGSRNFWLIIGIGYSLISGVALAYTKANNLEKPFLEFAESMLDVNAVLAFFFLLAAMVHWLFDEDPGKERRAIRVFCWLMGVFIASQLVSWVFYRLIH
jgi:hypothetical protein